MPRIISLGFMSRFFPAKTITWFALVILVFFFYGLHITIGLSFLLFGRMKCYFFSFSRFCRVWDCSNSGFRRIDSWNGRSNFMDAAVVFFFGRFLDEVCFSGNCRTSAIYPCSRGSLYFYFFVESYLELDSLLCPLCFPVCYLLQIFCF